MKNRLLNKEGLKEASLYITAVALCVLILCVFLKIWRADLSVPFYYTGDSIYYATVVKGIIENGWYWQNPSVGAPGTLLMYEFPGFDHGVGVLIWLISVFSRNPFLVMNIFYLLTFPLITVASLFVFRQFNLSYVPALGCSLLYAFLPYHFMRNETHLILSAYYVVPLAILVVLWVTRDDIALRSKKFIFSVVICLLLGTSGVYYPFFFCFLLLVAGCVRTLNARAVRPMAMALVFVGITSAAVAVNLLPSLIYRYKHGDVGVMQRVPREAETYGLKISQLVLPITAHRFDRFDRLKRFHNAHSLVTENDTSSLGIVGSIGFLALLGQLLRRKEIVSDARGLFQDLSILNLSALLLGLIGGMGILFSLFVSSGIRCYNRISVYIAFFSLLAFALAFESIYRRTVKRRNILYPLVAVAFVVGFFDQTTPYYVPDYKNNRTEFFNDRQFMNAIETAVPARAMIFQLPYIPFPEHPWIHKMVDYDHFRGYIHSNALRWSYGTIKNRDVDRAQAAVAALPTEEFVQRLAFAGFSGIYFDRYGYPDDGLKEAELSNVLQTKPLVSSNGRLLFFNLAEYAARLRQKYPESEWQAKQETGFHPLLVDWKGGFSGFETRPGKTWRWCSSEGELHLRNTSPRARRIKLEMAFATGHEQFDDFIISGFISEQLKVNFNPYFYSKTLTVPPGNSVITFRSSAKRVNAPLDTRYLVFRVEDFKMTELE